MSAQGEQRGIVLICGEDGAIVQLLRDDLGLADRVAVGAKIAELVVPDVREKLTAFLSEVRDRNAAYGWEIPVMVDRKFLLLHFSGARRDAGALVMAAPSRASLAHLNDENLARITSEQANMLRSMARELALTRDASADPGADAYDELSRVNNEMVNLQRELARKTAELQLYYEAAEEEQRVASHLMKQMVRADQLCDPLLRYWLEPAHNLNGDLIAAARTPAGVLHVLLADGTGHGLVASLNVFPMVDPFYAMTAKGLNVGVIAREVNAKMKRWLPTGHFVAAALIAYDPDEGMIEVWCGGVPPPFLLDAGGELVHEFASKHTALGVLPDGDFGAETEVIAVGAPGQLIVCSDGATEAQGTNGALYGNDRLLRTLRAAPAGQRLERLKEDLARHVGVRGPRDDVSVAIVDCEPGLTGRARVRACV